jgi:hypothetical protein
VSEPILGDAVLARVVRDDDAPAAGDQGADGGIEGVGQDLEFLVDGYADRLEDPPGRMAPGPASGGRDGVPHDRGQLSGTQQRAGGYDGPGDPSSKTRLAVVGEQLDQGALGPLVDNLSGRQATGRVHPHIKLSFLAVAETTVGPIELR